MPTSLIQPEQDILIWCILLAITFLGVYGDRKGWFQKISGSLVIILVGALLVTFQILPSAADKNISVSTYQFVFDYFIPFSIPLLLFNVELKKVTRNTGALLVPFLIGAVGVVVGALIASLFIDFGEETHKLAGTFYKMAPEQLNGGAIDSTTDNYNFAVVLYEILT